MLPHGLACFLYVVKMIVSRVPPPNQPRYYFRESFSMGEKDNTDGSFVFVEVGVIGRGPQLQQENAMGRAWKMCDGIPMRRIRCTVSGLW